MVDVLVVDDNNDIRDLQAVILRSAGYRVREARNGREALDLVEDRIPDVAIVDVEMPVLSGPEMAYELFVRDSGLEDIPVIFVSGIVGLSELAARTGTPYFLAKPYSLESLLRIVERALRERIPPRPQVEAQ